MTVVEHQGSIAIADTPEDLSAIVHSDVPAMVWHRHPLTRFQNWIDAVAPEHLPRARMILHPGNVREAAAWVCEICGTPDSAERVLLIDDIAALAHIFAELKNARYVLLRLDVVTATEVCESDNGATNARLVCTYRGTGTQCVVQSGGPDPTQVFTVPTGAPILLRDELCLVRKQSKLLHRSTPIEGTGETRLVLGLDAVPDPDEHKNQTTVH